MEFLFWISLCSSLFVPVLSLLKCLLATLGTQVCLNFGMAPIQFFLLPINESWDLNVLTQGSTATYIICPAMEDSGILT